MPEGVSRKPSFTRTLILPDVPWLMPRRFMSWHALTMALRSVSYFTNTLPRWRSCHFLVRDQDVDRQRGKRIADLGVRPLVGDEMRRLLEVADADRREAAELAVIGDHGGDARGHQHAAVQLALFARVVHQPAAGRDRAGADEGEVGEIVGEH